MRIGIFQSMLTKYGIEETAQKIRENNLDAVQLYFSFNGVPLTSKELIEDRELCERIRSAFANEGVEISGLCGYQNLVNPNEGARGIAIEELKRYIKLCERFDTNLVVTEVGSANPESNWADHPNNYTAETLNLAARVLQEVCDYAAEHHVVIGIEPHFAQVAKDPKSIRRILDLVKRVNLKVVFDPANLINAATADRADEILEELFTLNGNDIALLHAKDTKIVKDKAVFVAAGTGLLNYTLYGQLAKKYGYREPVILEYMSEATIPAAREVVERAFQA